MRRILLGALILAAAGAFVLVTLGTSGGSGGLGTYKIELDNGFGLVQGADFKLAGIKAGKISKIDLVPGCYSSPKGDPSKCHALVTVEVTQPGLGQFHADAFCQSRPQSLIGEYFIECQPGQKGPTLQPGGTIKVNQTQSTIPADLLANVMRMPYRQRFSLIINELGAAVAGRSGDLAAALRRAVPALDQTDNLLKLLANDSSTLQALTTNSDAVVTALANNSPDVQRFIVEANRAATDTATQQANLRLSLQRLPGFLEQLRPALQRLGAATDANLPVLANLNTASGQLNRLFTDLPGFSRSARPSLRSLGQASVTGTAAVQAAAPTITHLNNFAKSTPELGQNLAIVLHDLDSRNRAVEADSRSPNGQGYTGLEALLQYVFNQPLAINTFGQFGHQLTVDAFVSPMCTPYATQGTVATNLKQFGAAYRSCYAWLGPRQPGVNVSDPSAPGAAVPDPGGAPPGQAGPGTSARKLAAVDHPRPARVARAGNAPASRTATARSASGAAAAAPATAGGTAPATTGGGSAGGSTPAASSGAGSTPAASTGGSSGKQTQQLLNYLLLP